jgi:hypothetical protein
MNEDNVLAIRQCVWDTGYRPIPVVSYDNNGPSPGKRPLGQDWINAARLDPPFCVTSPPVAHALNTGILADGLRAVDIDVDDPALVERIQAEAERILGKAPRRTRSNSARILLLYRAWDGEPPKRSIAGKYGKVEILGRGQQFVAYGTHPSGVEIEWPDGGPTKVSERSLPPVTEAEIDEFLAAVAPIIGAPEDVRPTAGAGDAGGYTSRMGQRTSILAAADAMAQIRNEGPRDWERWNRIGMALWAATGGTEGGREVWHAWSGQHPAYDPDETNDRWDHYFNSPPTQIGAGTLFHMAGEASPGWKPAHLRDAPELSKDADDHDAKSGDVIAQKLGDCVVPPPRRWLYGYELIREYVSILASPGGVGKTAYSIVVGTSVALGRSLLSNEPNPPANLKVHKRGPVWMWNLEDPRDEILRRIIAVAKHYDIKWDEIKSDIHINSGRDRPLIVAARDRRGNLLPTPDVPALVSEIRRRGIVLLVVDPFVHSHHGDENSNPEMALVMAQWAQVAAQSDCAVLLVHHYRKGGATGDGEAARGASSLHGAARVMNTLSVMTQDEAGQFGIDESKRRKYIRLDNAKSNLAPAPENAQWMELVSVSLENATPEYPEGDWLQVVQPWAPAGAWDGITMADCVAILDHINAGPEPGEFYTHSTAGADNNRFAGNIITDRFGKTPSQARQIINDWVRDKTLIKEEYKSQKARRIVKCVKVDPEKLAQMRQQAGIVPQDVRVKQEEDQPEDV